jgi:hypothetical protein
MLTTNMHDVPVPFQTPEILQMIISVANYKEAHSRNEEKWFLWLSLKNGEAAILDSASSASAIATEKNREKLSFCFFRVFLGCTTTLAEKMEYGV